MMHVHFINYKMLIVFWFILSLQWKEDILKELDIHRQSLDTTNLGPLESKMLLSGDGQSWGCGKMLVPAKSQCPPKSDWSLFSKSRPCRWCTTTSVSPKRKWWCNRQSNVWVLEPRRASWYHSVWLCVHYQPQAFTQWLSCLILWQAAELEYTFPERAYLGLKSTMTEIIAIPAPGCSC